MSVEVAGIVALIGTGFFLSHLATNLKQDDKWLDGLSIGFTFLSFLCFITSVVVASIYTTDVTVKNIIISIYIGLIALGTLFAWVSGATWVRKILIGGYVNAGKKDKGSYGGDY